MNNQAFISFCKPLTGTNLTQRSFLSRVCRAIPSDQRHDSRGFSRWRASAIWRPNREDVDRISRGQAAKQRGTGSRAVPHRLNEEERRSYEQAIEQGYVSLGSNAGHRRERKGSPLFNTWRMWCDARGVPAIMFVKRGQRRPLDEVWIDLSVLRGQFPGDASSADDVLQLVDEKSQLNGIMEDVDVEDNDLVEEIEESIRNSECVPTWRIPENWIKYQFEDRAEAKQLAKTVSEMFVNDAVRNDRKSKVKKATRKARRPPRGSADDDSDFF